MKEIRILCTEEACAELLPVLGTLKSLGEINRDNKAIVVEGSNGPVRFDFDAGGDSHILTFETGDAPEPPAIKCPVCGSYGVTSEEKTGHFPVFMSDEKVPFVETVHTCGKCKESGDFSDTKDNDKRVTEAYEKAGALSAKAIIRSLREKGVTIGYIERVLHLPFKTLEKWEKGEAILGDTGLALLKIIGAHPWLLKWLDDMSWLSMAVVDMTLEPEAFLELVKAIKNPPAPNPALVELFKRFKDEGKPASLADLGFRPESMNGTPVYVGPPVYVEPPRREGTPCPSCGGSGVPERRERGEWGLTRTCDTCGGGGAVKTEIKDFNWTATSVNADGVSMDGTATPAMAEGEPVLDDTASLDSLLNHIKANAALLVGEVRDVTMGHSLVDMDRRLGRIQRACDHIQRTHVPKRGLDAAWKTVEKLRKDLAGPNPLMGQVDYLLGLVGQWHHVLGENGILDDDRIPVDLVVRTRRLVATPLAVWEGIKRINSWSALPPPAPMYMSESLWRDIANSKERHDPTDPVVVLSELGRPMEEPPSFGDWGLSDILNYIKANILSLGDRTGPLGLEDEEERDPILRERLHLERLQRACDHIQENFVRKGDMDLNPEESLRFATACLEGPNPETKAKVKALFDRFNIKYFHECIRCDGRTRLVNYVGEVKEKHTGLWVQGTLCPRCCPPGIVTKEKFVDDWCRLTGCRPKDVEGTDQEVVPCDCGEDECRGWKTIKKARKAPEGPEGEGA